MVHGDLQSNHQIEGGGKLFGLFTLNSNMGKVVMIFADMDSLHPVMAYAQRFTEPDREFAMAEITANSPTEAVQKLKEAGYAWSPDTTCVTNGQKPFNDFVAHFWNDLAGS
jgi:hypothetical protein